MNLILLNVRFILKIITEKLNLHSMCRSLCIIAMMTAFFSIAFLQQSYAGVTVFDDVGSVEKTMRLKALTKGRFFPEGGQIIKLYIDEEQIGQTLSGGDGYAFMKYEPSSPGLKKIKVEADGDIDTGSLLITEKGDKTLLIEIENTLFQSIMVMKPTQDAKETLVQLSKRFRIIYLIRMLGLEKSREWIKEQELPLSVVIKWTGYRLVDELQEKGVTLHAIIAPSDMLAEAEDIPLRFSFEDNEFGRTIKDWKDLKEQLK